MKKPFKRVLLHVGPPKTGTTSIQHFLFANRAALLTRGIHVPLSISRGVQHIELPLLLGPPREPLARLTGWNSAEIDSRRRSIAERFASEIAGAGGDTLLVTSEHLFGAKPEAIGAYRRFFEPYAQRFESLMYLRRQDRWLASSVLQGRKTGMLPVAELGVGRPRLFERSVRSWDADSDHCRIRRLEAEFLTGGDLLDDLCESIGCDIGGLDRVRPYNRAVLQEQIELVDALNEALAAAPFSRRIAYRGAFLSLCGEILGGAPFEFSRADAQAAFEAYAPINTWLRESRDPGGPPFFFNADFTMYPVRARNDRVFAIEDLRTLRSVIEERLGRRPPPTGDGESRADVISRIIGSFVELHETQAERERMARRVARGPKAGAEP